MPFYRGFDRYDLWAGALCSQSLNWGDFRRAQECLTAIQPGDTIQLSPDISTPGFVVNVSADYVMIAIQGTTTWAQWVCNVLGSVQAPFAGIPGQVALVFGSTRDTLWPHVLSFVGTRWAGRRVVLIGHSLGGAIAQVWVSLALAQNPRDVVAFVYGAPRTGNPAFAASLSGRVWRVETTQDPIAAIPPPVWAGKNSFFPIAGVPPVNIYEKGGAAQTLHSGGDLTDGDNGMTFQDVVALWDKWQAPTHDPSVYVNRLAVPLQLDPFPDSVGYADGNVLVGIDVSLNEAQPVIGVPGMSYLTMASMFFRANNGITEGWEESIFFSSDVPTILNLLRDVIIPARAGFLTSQAEIHAYRASRADGIRLAQSAKMRVPTIGQVSGPVNEFGDCINFLVDSADSQKRIMAFRGISDGWIEGQNVTPAGNAGLNTIQAFISLLKANGGSLKIPFGANPFLPIVVIANDPIGTGPIKVTTATPSGVTNNTLVTIRGLKGFPYLRGQWRAQQVDNLNFNLVGSQRYNINLTTNTGEVRVDEFVPSLIATSSFSGVGFRKTGRPFGSSRGKQPARIIRH